MKARKRSTNEIVDIISYSGSTERCPSYDRVSYIDSHGQEHPNSDLNFYWDFEPIDTDWQSLRAKAAIAAMQGILSSALNIGTPEECAELSVEYANALIEELKQS